MAKKQQVELSVKLIKDKLDDYRFIHKQDKTPATSLSKELDVKITVLSKFIQENKKHFSLKYLSKKGKDEKELCIVNVYEDIADNVENKSEYVNKRVSLFENTIKISYYNNYGSIHGYYLEPSKDIESEYLNTKEKILKLKDMFQLKPAAYHIGGYGDSSLIKPNDSFEISLDQLNNLVESGWTVIGEYVDLSNRNIYYRDLDVNKKTKK